MNYQYRVSCPQTGDRGTIRDTMADAMVDLDHYGTQLPCGDCHRIIRSDNRHWLSQEERNQ